MGFIENVRGNAAIRLKKMLLERLSVDADGRIVTTSSGVTYTDDGIAFTVEQRLDGDGTALIAAVTCPKCSLTIRSKDIRNLGDMNDFLSTQAGWCHQYSISTSNHGTIEDVARTTKEAK